MDNKKGIKSKNDEITLDDETDKKFVSQAVAFVIGHARSGFVALCASVASLLKEQARLKQEVEALQHEVLLLKQKTNKINPKENVLETESGLLLKNSISKPEASHILHNNGNISKKNLIHKSLEKLPYRLRECTCKHCVKDTNIPSVTAPLHKGDKVVIVGELSGIVGYIGHLDSYDFSQIYVGIQLSEPVGNSDGSIGNKRYFSVPSNYGLFIPLSHVLCVIHR